MRWSQGVWSEQRVVQAVNGTGRYFALPYGPSGTAPEDDVRAFELYFERLEAAGLGTIKRPDLLILRGEDRPFVENFLKSCGGNAELPFQPEEKLSSILSRAICAVECENSLWIARQMPDFAKPMRPQPRLGGRPGFPKSAVLPTVILKEEDRGPLRTWEQRSGIPVHVWHVFYDVAFGLAMGEAERLIAEGLITPTLQTFQAPGGATTKKQIYKIYYQYGYPLASSSTEPELRPDKVIDKNGHILPYVRFQGGGIVLSAEALRELDALANRPPR